MSGDYTPSTDELIARARQQTRGITDPSMRERLIIDLADALESVRAEVERHAKADALREAAADHRPACAEGLRLRADQIERGEIS
jgi:hypothetical protein